MRSQPFEHRCDATYGPRKTACKHSQWVNLSFAVLFVCGVSLLRYVGRGEVECELYEHSGSANEQWKLQQKNKIISLAFVDIEVAFG